MSGVEETENAAAATEGMAEEAPVPAPAPDEPPVEAVEEPQKAEESPEEGEIEAGEIEDDKEEEPKVETPEEPKLPEATESTDAPMAPEEAAAAKEEESAPEVAKPEDDSPKHEEKVEATEEEGAKEEALNEEEKPDETPEIEKAETSEPMDTSAAPDMDDASKPDEQSVSNDGEAEKTDDAMDTEDQDAAHTDQAEESAASKELPYSTRGRSTGNDTASGGENWEKGARETLEDMGRARDTSQSLGTSFLETLTEEERRTRTRFLPEVDGMHVLRKAEVKEDLALARSLVSSTGVSSLKKSKGKRSKTEGEAMDVDDDGTSPSEDDRSSDIARLGTSTIELPTRDLLVPSTAFLAPPGITSSDDGEMPPQNLVQSPLEVDAVTAFN